MLPPFLSLYHRKSLSMEIFLHLETLFSIWKHISLFGNIILHLETRFSIQKHHSPFGNTCYSCKIEVFEAVQMFFSLCFGLFRCFEEISSSHRLISKIIRLWEPALFLFSFTLYKSKYCAKKRIFSLFFQKSKETLKNQGFWGVLFSFANKNSKLTFRHLSPNGEKSKKTAVFRRKHNK